MLPNFVSHQQETMESMGFVDENHLHVEIEKIVKKTSNEITQFWSGWLAQNFNTSQVKKIFELGMNISEDLGKLKRV